MLAKIKFMIFKHRAKYHKEYLNKWLFIAVKKNDVGLVKILLKNNANPNEFFYTKPYDIYWSRVLGFHGLKLENKSIYCVALKMKNEIKTKKLKRKNLKIIKLLIEYEADINAKDNCSYTSLMNAVDYGNLELCDVLIKEGADVNLCNNLNHSPLWVASYNGYYDIVKLLIKNNAKINDVIENKNCPLLIATLQGHFKICRYLIKNGADIAKFKNVCISIALQYNHMDIVRLLNSL